MKYFIVSLLACLLSLPVLAASSVNINTAPAEEIAAALKGVGLSKAEEIVRYRETNGAFVHIDELVSVKGIGMKTVDKNRENIQLDGAQADSQK